MADRILLSALRRDDFLALQFELLNLRPSDDGQLTRVEDGAPAVIVVHFPSQHLAERVFSVASAAAGTLDDPPIATALAGGSRLAFRLPDTMENLALTLEALLDWSEWQPILAPGALPRDTPPPGEPPAPGPPGESETAIEFPWRLLLSPDATAGWRHDRIPLALNGKTQLWRTHLSRIVDPGNGETRRVDAADLRALADVVGAEPDWTSLLGPDPDAIARWSSLTALNRRQIVQLSSNYGIALPPAFGGPTYIPRPIHAEQFSLSTLGATARLEGKWDFPLIPPEQLGAIEPLGLQQYRHVAAQGRDHFVRTVWVGFLCGTGHRATIVTTTERLTHDPVQVGTSAAGGPLIGGTAFLLQSSEVVVVQPEIDYGALDQAYAFGGREMPLRSIRLLTTSASVVTPSETTPEWLMSALGTPLLFRAAAIDLAGNRVEFELPLMFVPYEAFDRPIQEIANLFRNPPPDVGASAHRIELGAQDLAFAAAGETPGSTVLRTEFLTYDIEIPDALDPNGQLNASALPASYVPRFAPRIMGASAIVPAVAEIIGDGAPLAFAFDPLYLRHGFDPGANQGQSFARFAAPLALEFASQRGGGLASPRSLAEGLSRTLGPVAKPDQLAAGAIDLSAFASARFLGTINLLDIIEDNLPVDAASVAATLPLPADLDNPAFRLNAPRLITRRLPEGGAVPQEVETRFVWKPTLKSETFGILTLELGEADLLLDARVTRSASGSGSALTLGRLRNAGLSFEGAISVHFEELLFRAEDGKKLEVGAKGVNLLFGGPLNFVNSLQSILPASGFDDPPFVTVDGQGIVAGYTLGVPSIGVGIFSLQNIALSAALSIPFTDRPAGVRFGVSERHKPFLLSVSGFGGGGFFAMAVSAKGLEQIEASLEFGGNISINLVVASGGVYVMAGIYFGLTGTSVTLTGYLRCGGSLEVLGLISISVEFYLAFTYRKKDGAGSEVWGQASLTVSIEIAFFSTSVSLSVERRFAGSDGDPSFSQSVTPRDWATYLLAFAQ